MIIRLTVNDNDFSEIIENYFSDFLMRMFELHPDAGLSEKSPYEELNDWRKRENKIRGILNPNSDHELSADDKKFIAEQVERTLLQYINRHYPEDTRYFKDNLEISFCDAIYDKWENGEAFYWLQHSGAVINQ